MRRNPGMIGYLALVLVFSIIVTEILPDGTADDVLKAVSTNLANVDWSFPLRLVASAFVVDLTGYTALVILVGVIGCLGWLERRFGTLRAFGIFLAIHVGVTLITLVVVVVAIRTGIYPDDVRDELDYGVSYGAIGCTGAVTFFLPKWARVPWAAAILLVPLVAAEWYGWFPDFSTVGHVLSAVSGLVISSGLVGYSADKERRERGDADSVSGGGGDGGARCRRSGERGKRA